MKYKWKIRRYGSPNKFFFSKITVFKCITKSRVEVSRTVKSLRFFPPVCNVTCLLNHILVRAGRRHQTPGSETKNSHHDKQHELCVQAVASPSEAHITWRQCGGLPWWSSGKDSELPMQVTQDPFLVWELDFTCCN